MYGFGAVIGGGVAFADRCADVRAELKKFVPRGPKRMKIFTAQPEVVYAAVVLDVPFRR